MNEFHRKLSAGCAGLLAFGTAFAQDAPPATDSGDTAWILTATALVLMMTLPALALFYGGLVRAKNLLSVLMHCLMIAALASILWTAGLYSLAFKGEGAWLGDLSAAFLKGVTPASVTGTIPEPLFAMFQMTFAIITPCLVVGAFVERIRFSAVLIFSALWLIVVYAPVTHWAWAASGWMFKAGVVDLAGGIVVHATAGTSALVLAAVLGKRRGFPGHLQPPHSPWMVVTGTGLLWVGWFGFNAGSQLAANGAAGMTLLVTHLAAATATLAWSLVERLKTGKTGIVASRSVSPNAACRPRRTCKRVPNWHTSLPNSANPGQPARRASRTP